MSLQAVGWLSAKLGINIAGRVETDDAAGNTNSAFDVYLHKINNAVFGRDGINNGGGGDGGLMHVASHGGGAMKNGEEVELDENGLPVSKNWYYYDKGLGRWNVSSDAPEHIKQEHQRRLQEEEDEREGRNVISPPPPPPPPPPAAAAAALSSSSLGPVAPGMQQPHVYPSVGRFTPGAPQQGAHPHGFFSMQTMTGSPQHRPQYAVPTYFDATPPPPTSTMEASHSGHYQQPQQQANQHEQQPGYQNHHMQHISMQQPQY